MPASGATLTAIPGIALARPGDDAAALLIEALERARLAPAARDVLVIAQKLVSKCEGRYVELAAVVPSARARALAAEVGKDPRLVQVILSESRAVLRKRRGVLVVEHRLGFVMANAGIDQSNIEPAAGGERVLLLPRDPDASARTLRARLQSRYGVDLAVIVSDSFGRAWRHGTTGVALGAAGLPALLDLRGRRDLYGRELRVSQSGLADEIAAAASLLMGQADEGLPAVLLRGLRWEGAEAPAAALLREESEDLFR